MGSWTEVSWGKKGSRFGGLWTQIWNFEVYGGRIYGDNESDFQLVEDCVSWSK